MTGICRPCERRVLRRFRMGTWTMCLEAVKTSCGTLRYVPDRLRTHEICEAAVAEDPEVLTELWHTRCAGKI